MRPAPLETQEGRPAPVLGPLLVLGFVLALLQLAVLLMPPEELSPGGLPRHEEWRRGMAAREWVVGPLLPYLDYQQGHFQGGTLVTIGLDVLSFGVLGDSPFAMRLPNLLFLWATLAFVFLFVDRIAGRRAAWIAGVFAAVSAPCYQIVGACAWASHVEANGLAMAVLFLWLRHVFGGKDRARDALLLGVVAGFANWYHYGVAVWFVCLLAIEHLLDLRALFRRRMGLRALGWLVGFSPWFAYNVTHEWEGLGVYGKSAGAHFQTEGEAVRETFARLWTEFLPGSIAIPDLPGLDGSGRVLELVLLALAVLAWVWVSAGALRALLQGVVRPELVLALYPPLWTVLYTFGTFHGQDWWLHGYRYMLPLHPIAWISGGIVLARMCGTQRAVPRRAPQVAVALVALGMVAALVPYLRPDRASINWNAPGYYKESIGRWLFLRRGKDAEILKEACDRAVLEREPVETDMTLFTLGNCLLFAASQEPLPKWPEDRRAAVLADAAAYEVVRAALHAHVPERYRPYFAQLRKGERAFKWPERERFWRQWDKRGEGRPEGAYAH